MDEIVKSQSQKYSKIYKDVLLIDQITKDINTLTVNQENKMDSIITHIEPVVDNSKDIYRTLIETSEEDKKFKTNNCIIIMLIAFSLFFLLIILMHWG
jgi:hypothetical protein